jgi:hypothetical protein
MSVLNSASGIEAKVVPALSVIAAARVENARKCRRAMHRLL